MWTCSPFEVQAIVLALWSLHIISTPKEFGGIDPRFKYEEKAMQQIFAGIECNTVQHIGFLSFR